jgi:hypothetical protein
MQAGLVMGPAAQLPDSGWQGPIAGQSGGLATAVQQVVQGEPGVMPQHAQAAPLHDQLYLFAHGRGIAVDVAVGTGGFVAVTIAAAPQALVGECLQLLAVSAGGILMMVVAVEADHGADRLLLAHESGVVTRLFADCGV